MKTLFVRSLAVLISGSLLLDPGLAHAVTLNPSPIILHAAPRFSEDALNNIALWQHVIPLRSFSLKIRNHLTALSASIATVGAGGAFYALWQAAHQVVSVPLQTIAPLAAHLQQFTISVPQTVIVHAGDTLSELFGMKQVDAIFQLNKDVLANVNQIYVGQALKTGKTIAQTIAAPDHLPGIHNVVSPMAHLPVFAHPMLHALFEQLSNPLFWVPAAIVAIMGIGLWAYKRWKKNQPAADSAPVSYWWETELAEARSIEDPAARKDVLQGIAQRLRAYVYGPERPSYNGRTGTYAMESAEAAAKMGAAMKALPMVEALIRSPSPISRFMEWRAHLGEIWDTWHEVKTQITQRNSPLRFAVIGVQFLLILWSALPGFSAAKSINDLFKAATDQYAEHLDKQKEAGDAAAALKKHVPKATFGVQTIFENQGGGASYKFVGPTVSLPFVPLPHSDPMAPVDSVTNERKPEYESAQKRQALRDYLDKLTSAAAAYAERGAYVDALTEQLAKLTDDEKRQEVTDALDLAKNQMNEAENTFKEVAQLPEEKVGTNESITTTHPDQTLLGALHAAADKGFRNSAFSPEAVIAEIDASKGAAMARALSGIHWRDHLPTGFSASLSWNLLSMGLVLSNGTLILPHYATLDPVKDKETIEKTKAAIEAVEKAAKKSLQQAFIDWKAAQPVPDASPTEEDPLVAAQSRAAVLLSRWNALGTMNHFGVTEDLFTTWLSLSDDERNAKIAEYVQKQFVTAQPALDSWLALITPKLPKPKEGAEKQEASVTRVTVDPVSIVPAYTNHPAPVYNGQPQIDKGVTGGAYTYIKFLRNTKKIGALTTAQTKAAERLEHLPENSVEYAQQNYILLVCAERLAEAKRDPIVINPGAQQSKDYSYGWIYLGAKPLLAKVGEALRHVINKKTPADVERSIREARLNFKDGLERSLRQVVLDKEIAETIRNAARTALAHRQALPEDKAALEQAQATVSAAEKAYAAAMRTYNEWLDYVTTEQPNDELWKTFFTPTVEYTSGKTIKGVRNGLWTDVHDQAKDSADYAVRKAELHLQLLKGENLSYPTGVTYDSSVLGSTYMTTRQPGRFKDTLFVGVNLVTNYDPAARGNAKDARAKDIQEAEAAVIAAKRDRALVRAQTYPAISAAVNEAVRLTELAARPGIAGTPLEHQLLAAGAQKTIEANRLAQKAGLCADDFKPVAREDLHVLHVPDARALTDAILDALKPSENAAQKHSWLRRVLDALVNVPVTGTHYFQRIGPLNQAGTQATVGAFDVEDLPGLRGTKSRLIRDQKNTAKADGDLADAMNAQELFYKIQGLKEILEGRPAAENQKAVQGLVELSVAAAQRVDEAQQRLDQALTSKADNAKIFVLTHRYTKTFAAYNQLLAKVDEADMALRGLILVLPQGKVERLEITDRPLPLVPPVVTALVTGPMPQTPLSPAAEALLQELPTIEPPVSEAPDNTNFPTSKGTNRPNPGTNLIAPTAPSAPKMAVTRRLSAARRAELARQAEAARQATLAQQAEQARQAELAHQAELARQADAARQAEAKRLADSKKGTQMDQFVDWSMDHIGWLFGGLMMLAFLIGSYFQRRRPHGGSGTRFNSQWLGLSVIGLALPLIGGSIAIGHALFLGGFMLQLMPFVPWKRAGARLPPPSGHTLALNA